MDEVHGAGRTPCRIPGPHGIAACCFPLAAQEVLQEVVGEAVLRGVGGGYLGVGVLFGEGVFIFGGVKNDDRSEEHTSELKSPT